MAFSQSTITAGPLSTRDGLDTIVSWTSSDTPPVTYQVYVDRRLAWNGTKTKARIQIPPDGATHEIAVGTCLPEEARVDLSAALPAPLGGSGNRAVLSWQGGTFLDERIAGFHVYQGATAGAMPVTSGEPEATVVSYPQGVILDGFGLGGFGDGGFGRASASYSWTSNPLASGTWHFSVLPFNDAGNLGAGTTLSVTIVAPPAPPMAGIDGTRINVAYDATSHKATLTWTPA